MAHFLDTVFAEHRQRTGQIATWQCRCAKPNCHPESRASNGQCLDPWTVEPLCDACRHRCNGEAEIRAAADAEIAKINADLSAKLTANAAQQAEVKAQMAKES